MREALAHGASALALACVIVPFSELWFYPVDVGPSAIGILLAYAVLGLAFTVALARFEAWSRSGLVVAAALTGFLIEAVPVAALFEAPPLTIVWTSLAWHALLSLGVGWWLVRRWLRRSIAAATLGSVALGVLLGVWGAYGWNASEAPDGTVRFDWTPWPDYAAQMAVGTLVFALGHAMLNLAPPPERAGSALAWGVAIVIGAAFAAGSLVAAFPLSLLLVPLVVLSLAALARAEADARVRTAMIAPVPLARLPLLALVPVFATATYAATAAHRIEWEVNALVFVIAGTLSVALWLLALTRLLTTRREGPA